MGTTLASAQSRGKRSDVAGRLAEGRFPKRSRSSGKAMKGGRGRKLGQDLAFGREVEYQYVFQRGSRERRGLALAA